MGIFRTLGRKALLIGLSLVTLLAVGCAGIKPYKPHDYREDGLKRGLFSGSKGEFIIYKKVAEPETGSETGKSSDEAVDDEQKKQPEKPTDGNQ